MPWSGGFRLAQSGRGRRRHGRGRQHRELFEKPGATAAVVRQVFLASVAREGGFAVHPYLHARHQSVDLGLRNGPEVAGASRGTYDVVHVDLKNSTSLDGVNLVPAELKALVVANRVALLAEAGVL